MSGCFREERKLHIVGAGSTGGVRTYALNVAKPYQSTRLYGYREFCEFWRDISKGDVIFLNVIKPSLLF